MTHPRIISISWQVQRQVLQHACPSSHTLHMHNNISHVNVQYMHGVWYFREERERKDIIIMKRQIQTSICLSVCLSIYLSIYLHQSIPLSLSAYESIHIFICLSIHPSTYSFIYSYNYISISEKNGERIFIFVHLLHITFIYMRYIHSFFIHIYLRSSFSPTQHKTMYQKLASLDT